MGETVNILVMVPGCIQNRETHAYGFRARGSFLFVLDRGIILSFWLFLSNLLLGAGLAMDAFSVSLANGLQEPYMKKRKMTLIAGVFGFFQFAMPFIGWICVNMLIGVFQFLWPLIPWISLILFCAIGGFMIKDGLDGRRRSRPFAGPYEGAPPAGDCDLHRRPFRRLYDCRIRCIRRAPC